MKRLLAIIGLCLAIPPLLVLFFVAWFALPSWVGWVVLGLFVGGFFWVRSRRAGSLPSESAGSGGKVGLL